MQKQIRTLVSYFVFRAGENKNVWIDGNDEASEGNFVFTDGSPGEVKSKIRS